MNTPLARTRRGVMIHRRSCGQITKREFKPWLWADDKSELEIAGTIVSFGYLTCKHCKPIDWRNYILVVKSWGGVPITVIARVAT